MPARRIQSDVVLEFVAEEHRFALVLADEHLAAESFVLVGREQAVEVAQLHDGAYFLVEGDGLLGVVELLLVEVRGLHLHAQASRHRHVEAELQGDDAPRLVVGRSAHMLRHRHRREEVAGAPLDEEALLGVGVVAHPELVEVGQCAPVHASAAAGAELDDEVGIGLADALQGAPQPQMVVHEEVALAVRRQIAAAEVLHRHVAVPLDVVQRGVFLHQPVHDAHHEVLHLGVGEVEHQLCAAAPLGELACGMGHHPVGMGLVEFTLAVGHLGLYPDAELQSAVFRRLHQCGDAPGQFHGVGHPVAQGFVVACAAVFPAKPSVVHHEELSAQRADAVHHLLAHFLVDVHIDAFPRVEQDLPERRAVVQLSVASPAVEGAAHAALTLLAVGQRQGGGGEALAALQCVGRVQTVDAGQQGVTVSAARLDAQAVVARPAEGCADDASAVLAGLAVERDHHFGAVVHSRAHAVVVHDGLESVPEGLLRHLGLVAPIAVEVGQPGAFLPDGHHAAGILLHPHGFLLPVAQLGPGLDDVAPVVTPVAEVHEEVVFAVLQADNGHVALPAPSRGGQLRRHVAVGVGHAECRLSEAVASEGGVGLAAQGSGVVHLTGLFGPEACAVVGDAGCMALVHGEHQGRLGCVDENVFRLPRQTQGQGQ